MYCDELTTEVSTIAGPEVQEEEKWREELEQL